MFDKTNHCQIILENCIPYEVTIERGDIHGMIDEEEAEMLHLSQPSPFLERDNSIGSLPIWAYLDAQSAFND